MSNKKFDLIGFDNPFLDLVIEIDRLPESNTNCPMYERCFQGGGNVATALVAASRLGLETSLLDCVGDDLFGKMSIADAYTEVEDAVRYVNETGIDALAIMVGSARWFRCAGRSDYSCSTVRH